ncbi:MAG TPA: helix-turn-helix domain-containing protein [Pseudonocardiaceae bacterium]|nr:helix-turn-helix domain-containing protein [Pseudonocardiaceae bacterium]
MDEARDVGARVREVRKRRGLTQRELAVSSGVSVSVVRKLEQGIYGGLRLETAHKLAVVLRVPTSALLTGPDAREPDRDSVEQWDSVRRALEGTLPVEDEGEPTFEGVSAAFAEAVPLLVENRYAEVGVLLPGLLHDADALVESSVNGSETEARGLRAQIRQVCALLMSHTWQFSVADHAIALAVDDASDPLTQMSVIDEQCWGLIRAGRLTETRELATRWADEAEPRMSRAGRDELAAWGRFLLRVSTAAVRDNRPGEARDALRLARMAAAGGGSDFLLPYNPWQVFGPVTVSIIQAENAMILDRPEVTLAIGSQLEGRPFPVSRHYHRHRLDVAHAHVALRQYAEAVGILQEIRGAAPEWLGQQRYAGDILAKVIEHRRSLTVEMRELADFLHLAL